MTLDEDDTAGLDDPQAAVQTLPLRLLSGLSLAEYGACVVLEQIDRLSAREAGARSGEDPEDLHKMRVATRRLRVAFRVFGRALRREHQLKMPADDVRTLARALGVVRDADVFAERLRQEAREHDGHDGEDRAALERLREDRLREGAAAREELKHVLDGPALKHVADDVRLALLAILERDGAAAGERKGKQTMRKAGRRLLLQARRRFIRAARALEAPTSEELHQVRIEAKRFRYVCEFLQPLYGAALAEAIQRTTAIQDALGELHDIDVASEVLLRDVERLSRDEARCGDTGAVARFTGRLLARRDALLLRFREAWGAFPDERALRRQLKSTKKRRFEDTARPSLNVV